MNLYLELHKEEKLNHHNRIAPRDRQARTRVAKGLRYFPTGRRATHHIGGSNGRTSPTAE